MNAFDEKFETEGGGATSINGELILVVGMSLILDVFKSQAVIP